MNFEWDENKNIANMQKHGFDFADAVEVFSGPMVVCPDNRFEYGEDRYIGIGLIQNRIVIVVFTEPSDNSIRIISLRKAKKHERKIFEDKIKNRLG